MIAKDLVVSELHSTVEPCILYSQTHAACSQFINRLYSLILFTWRLVNLSSILVCQTGSEAFLTAATASAA